MDSLEATVAYLFRELFERNIRYVVLRNYETLPSLKHADGSGEVTDIDLTIHSADLPLWRQIAANAGRKFGWDVVTECDHWTQSRCPAHHIEVFRFYHSSPLEFIQVDVFHSYLVWGVPVLNEQELLQGRWNNGRGITCIDPAKEVVYALMKTHWISGAKNRTSKLSRYRERTLNLWRLANVNNYVRYVFSSAGDHAFEALEKRDMRRFSRCVKRGMRFAFWRKALLAPSAALRHMMARRTENRLRFFERPCGRVVRVHAGSEEARNLLRCVLESFVARNVFDEWKEKPSSMPITLSDRYVMEQGGPVVEWSDSQGADLEIDESSSQLVLTLELLDLLIAQDKILFAGASKQFEVANTFCSRSRS